MLKAAGLQLQTNNHRDFFSETEKGNKTDNRKECATVTLLSTASSDFDGISFPISGLNKFLTVFKNTDDRLRTCREDEWSRNEKSSFFRVVKSLNARLKFTRLGS